LFSMDPHSILDKHTGEAAQDLRNEASDAAAPPANGQDDMRFPAEDGGKSLAEMAERDLTATLQLLAERAQYITGATGAAIALRDHEEMVCRASAGSSAPEVGAQLQVNSGLSGESVRTRQTLRCDDAATDTRVNRESCEALGIRSVVVMPLLRGDEVIGVFELFSDQANVFETRDLAALERMGAMVHTALEHSAAALGLEPLPSDQPTRPSLPVSGNGNREEIPEAGFAEDNGTGIGSAMAPDETFTPHANASEASGVPSPSLNSSPGIAFHMKMPPTAPPSNPSPAPVEVAARHSLSPVDSFTEPVTDELDILEEPADLAPPPPAVDPADDILVCELEASAQQAASDRIMAPEPGATQPGQPDPQIAAPPAAPVSRGAVASLRKCQACGFPVSEGRQLCLDCEKKKALAQPTPAAPATAVAAVLTAPARPVPQQERVVSDAPHFLGGEEEEESWLATHKLMVIAIVMAVIAIVVVVFLR
jgi:putative methionine-R-sulfoxide reductase with GAF domain